MNILFSQVREDPKIEKFVIDKLNKNNINTLIVGSGGCTILSLLEDKINSLDIIDQNFEQLNLIKLKLAVLVKLKDKDKVLQFFEGKLSTVEYDKTLDELELDEEVKTYWSHNKSFIYSGINRSGKFELLFKKLVESEMNFDENFDSDYLISIFGKDAVVHSKNFADHFKNIVEKYEKNYSPEENYFYYQILNNCYHKDCLPPYFDNVKNIENNKNKINYICNNFATFLSTCENNSYDIIQTSNLTDWMNSQSLDRFLQNLFRCTKVGGYVVLRRLNGDYSLKSNVAEYFIIINNVPEDESHFYSEVVVGLKK